MLAVLPAQAVSDREYLLKLKESIWLPQNTHYGEEVMKWYLPKEGKERRNRGQSQKATPSWQVIASEGLDSARTWIRNEHRWRWNRRQIWRVKLFRQRDHDRLNTPEDIAIAEATKQADIANAEITWSELDYAKWRGTATAWTKRCREYQAEKTKID
jgi:hypothetical protein